VADPAEQYRGNAGGAVMKWPPYTKLAAKCSHKDEMRIYFGDSQDVWIHARIRNTLAPPALILPPGTRAESFSWPVANWSVFAIQCGDYPIEEIRKLARLMLQSGALVFRVLYGKGPDMATFRPAYRKTEQ
jgi:hypothetical protein